MKELPPDNLFDFDAYMERLGREPQPLDPAKDADVVEQEFHHSTCKNSRCTTCSQTKTCEIFADLADMSMSGSSACMAECDEYEPVKFRKLPTTKKGFSGKESVN